MQLLKQSTAATHSIGPVLDSAGAEYTGLVIADLTITKNGTSAAMAAAATVTHTSNGHYDLLFTTGNTDTLGRLTIRVNKATYQMPPVEFQIMADAMFASMTATSGGSIPNAVAGATGGGFIAGTNAATAVTTSFTTTFTGNLTGSVGTVTGSVGSVDGSVDSVSTAVDIGTWLGTAVTATTAGVPNVNVTAINNVPATAVTTVKAVQGIAVDGTITTLTNLPSIPAAWLTAAGIDTAALNGKGDWNTTVPPTAAANSTAVWEELTATARTAGTYGQLVKDDINATISSRMATTHLDATAGKLDGVALVDLVTTTTTNTDMLTAAAVNAEVVDALSVDTYAEPTGAPASTDDLATKIGYVYMALRNKIDVDSGFKEFYDDAGNVEWKKALSDDASNYIEAKGEVGP